MPEISQILVPTPVPGDISQLVDQFKQLESRISEINKACRDLKERMGYKQVSDNLKPVKELLYQYMTTNKLRDLSGIKVAKVKPSAVKTEERQVKMAERIETALEDVIPDQASDVAPIVLDAVLNK
jgi:hypothetical protein